MRSQHFGPLTGPALESRRTVGIHLLSDVFCIILAPQTGPGTEIQIKASHCGLLAPQTGPAVEYSITASYVD